MVIFGKLYSGSILANIKKKYIYLIFFCKISPGDDTRQTHSTSNYTKYIVSTRHPPQELRRLRTCTSLYREICSHLD